MGLTQVHAEERHGPVDMEPLATAEIASDRFTRLKRRGNFLEQRVRLGHAPALRLSSSTGNDWRIISRSATSDSRSGSPVHSSMKTFLNSIAVAQPVCGKCSWMKRVCSP